MQLKQLSYVCVYGLFATLLIACDSNNASTLTPPTADLAITEDTSTGLRGSDTNNNSIRDDVDALIAQKFSANPELKRAAEQDARAAQQLMEATTKEEAVAASKQNTRSNECLLRQFANIDEYISASRTIEALTANTRERLKKYLQSNKLLSGTVHSLPASTEQVCDE